MKTTFTLLAILVAIVALLIVTMIAAGPSFRWNAMLTIQNAYDDFKRDNTSSSKRLKEAEARLINNPDDAEAWFEKGLALKNKATRNEALAAADRAIALVPEQEKYHWLKCFSAFSLYEPAEALAILEEHASKFPRRTEPWSWMYFVYNKMDNYEKSVMCKQRVAEIEPNAGNYGFLASTMLSGGEVEESLPYFDKALKLMGDVSFYKIQDRVLCAIFSSDKARVLSLLGKHKEALELVEQAKMLNPNDTFHITPQVYANVALGHQDKAVYAAEHVHFHGPSENRILAYALLSRNEPGDLDRARNILQRELNRVTGKDAVDIYALLDYREKTFELMAEAIASNPHMKEYFRLSPEFENLRDDPRFALLTGA